MTCTHILQIRSHGLSLTVAPQLANTLHYEGNVLHHAGDMRHAMCLELACAMCLELDACLCHVLGAPQKLPAVAVCSLGLRAVHSIAGTWDGLCSPVIAKRKAVGDRRCDSGTGESGFLKFEK